MRDKGLAGSGGEAIALNGRSRRRFSLHDGRLCHLHAATPILLTSLLSITLLNPAIVGCDAGPLVVSWEPDQQKVRLLPVYYADEDDLEGDNEAQSILGGRRLFHSASQLHSHPLRPPIFIPVVRDVDADIGEDLKQKRRPQSAGPPTVAAGSVGEKAVTSMDDQKLLRIERNPGQSRELYQIHTVGDMPVLRFGRRR